MTQQQLDDYRAATLRQARELSIKYPDRPVRVYSYPDREEHHLGIRFEVTVQRRIDGERVSCFSAFQDGRPVR